MKNAVLRTCFYVPICSVILYGIVPLLVFDPTETRLPIASASYDQLCEIENEEMDLIGKRCNDTITDEAFHSQYSGLMTRQGTVLRAHNARKANYILKWDDKRKLHKRYQRYS